MKGLQPLFLGVFGIFAFSWLGMTVVPNLQIGHLDPQSDEEGAEFYPVPQSGMVTRGARVYAANGCYYCHSQQVRPDYGGADLERKWGLRRSAPRDYIFEPIVFLGKMRMGPDLANVGHRLPLSQGGGQLPAANPTQTGSAASPAASATPAASPGAAASPSASPSAPAATAGASPSGSPGLAPAIETNAPPVLPPAGNKPAATVPTSAPSLVENPQQLTATGEPLPYTAAWHHRHLYNPRSIVEDSNMPAFRFLYEKRRISGERSPDSLNFAGDTGEEPESGWEIVPSYDAKCLVAYLMSRDQTHELKEAKSPVAIAPAPGTEAKKP